MIWDADTVRGYVDAANEAIRAAEAEIAHQRLLIEEARYFHCPHPVDLQHGPITRGNALCTLCGLVY